MSMQVLGDQEMSAMTELDFSPLFTFPSPIRELCALDEDCFLFCIEGDTNVYEGKVSERMDSSLGNPGKLFCKVPYFGIPLAVGGGRAGRVVVVVPTDKNKNAETIEQWVTAIDSLSQVSVPAPVRGRWSAAAVHQNSIYLRNGRTPELFAVPTSHMFFPPPENVESPYTQMKIKGYPSNVSPSLKLLGGRLDDLIFYNDRGVCRIENSDTTSIRIMAPSTELRITAAGVFRGDSVFLGTASGEVHFWDGGDHKCVWRSESATNPQITAIALLPDASLLCSQGSQLLVYKGRRMPGCPDIVTLPPNIWAMRRLVFEGGKGSDVELVVKAESDHDGSGEARESADDRKVYGMKWMLSDTCEFFRSAFQGPFAESTMPTFQMPDTTFEALRCVVLFLHTGIVEVEESFAVDVAALARFLGLFSLQGQVELFMMKRIALTNCASLLLSAERLKIPDLRKHCIKFAAQNIKEVRNSVDFRKLSAETMYKIVQTIE
uniref:BTB domain-containing protein n=1 Tax=Chromera velia CCMP2878 TaxID=1169474 RepID=A0A0G4GJP8_9ALVE|eukprot:Cvel_22195.t1-p1 / transcript=Cvel_22195.t1 / gene=Cvel_22195 / organism=Chromera_velia_CCMP2878 / gene_product=Kelch-like protein 20, putative / transcript_product=Kelch-like protein 20, putative / location=Cvel_scaffold2156:10412-12243(-) / protein_length=490 / sequence_SO=supercontig / SO=protein_coding / is_pseudo=false